MKLFQDFKSGFMAPFQGIRFLFKFPSLLRLALIPFLINILLFIGLIFTLYKNFEPLIALLITKPETWYWVVLYYIFYAVALVLLLILGTLILCLIGNILASPFHEWIAQKVKTIVKGDVIDAPFSFAFALKEFRRIFVTQCKKLSLIVILVLFSLFLVLIPGAGIFLSGFISLLLLTLQFMDFPFEIERLSFSQQLHFFFHSFFAWIGFGLAISCLLTIPLLNLLVLPVGVIGASLLYYKD